MESLKNPWKVRWSFASLSWSDSLDGNGFLTLVEGCVVNVLGLGYHDVTSPRGDGSCPTMTGLCSRVDGGNGIDTVKAMITDISLNFISLCLSFGVQNTIGRKRKF